MSNIITILPPPTPNVQPAQLSQGNAPPQAIVPNLPPGTIITGFIVNRDPSGNPILRTGNGDITFSSDFFLKIGSEVTIRIETSAGNSLAHILSVDGQSPEAAEAQSSFAKDPNVIIAKQFNPADTTSASAKPSVNTQTSTASAVNETPTPLGSTLKGTLISQTQQSTASSQPIPVGTQISLKIVSVTAAESTLPPEVVASASVRQPTQPLAAGNQTQATSAYAAYTRSAVTPPVTTVANTTAPAAPAQTVTAPIVPATTAPAATVAAPSITIPNPTPQATAIAVQTSPSSTITVQTAATAPPAPTAQPPAPQTNVVVPDKPALTPLPPAAPTPTQTTTVQSPLPRSVTVQQSIPSTTTPNQALQSLLPQNPASPTLETAAPVYVPPTASNQPIATGQIITAKVIGNEPSGEALLQTHAGVVRLEPGTVIPPGSTIVFEVTQTTAPLVPTLPVTGTQPTVVTAPITELAQQWTAVQLLFNLLAQRPTNTGLNVQPYTLPDAPDTPIFPPVTAQSVSTGLLVFIAALRSGNFDNWLGKDNIKWLRDQGHDEILKKAGGEFQSLARQFTAQATQEWQPLFFPVAVEGQLQQVRIFVKRDGKQQSKDKKSAASDDTRFVIEVDLSKLGEMQMDGFVRRASKDMQFDMIIRSLTPLPDDIQKDILHIYNETGALTGYKGTLVFQAVKAFPINPMDEIAGVHNTVMA